MKPWIKIIIEILIIIVLFSLLAELIIGATLDYKTGGQGRFKEGLDIEGEIEYNVDNLDMGGESWVAHFYNLSSVYIGFYNITDVLFQGTLETSNLTIISKLYGDRWPGMTLNNITNISKFSSATFLKNQYYIQLGKDNAHVIGAMKNTTKDDDLAFWDAIVHTDNETINVSQSGAVFYMTGETGIIQFDVSFSGNYMIETYTENDDKIHLIGELRGDDFEGNIWSGGKLYFYGNPKLSGDIKLKIVQNAEVYYNHNPHHYDWEIEVEGEDVEVEGFGFPFWSIGLILSIIPSLITIAYHVYKKIQEERRKNPKKNS